MTEPSVSVPHRPNARKAQQLTNEAVERVFDEHKKRHECSSSVFSPNDDDCLRCCINYTVFSLIEKLLDVSVPTESRPTDIDWAERAAERIHLLYRDANYFKSMPKAPLIEGWAEIIRTELFKTPPVTVGESREPLPEESSSGPNKR